MTEKPEPKDLAAEHEHKVRVRAHQIWIEEGKPEGRALDHWLRAKWEWEPEPGRESDGFKDDHDFDPQ